MLTQKLDVWALGIILYQMVFNGGHPYGTLPGKPTKIIALKSTEPVEIPDLHRSIFKKNVPGLRQTLAACLEKDPGKRASVDQLLAMEFLSFSFLDKI